MFDSQSIFLLLAGLLAGFINTIAGSGSIFTLGIMLFFNIPSTVANGSNRLGILTQGITNFYMFHKKGKIPYKTCWQYVFPSLIGALIGAYVSTDISDNILEIIIAVMMSLVVFSTFLKKKIVPKKTTTKHKKKLTLLKYLLFFIVGFYGGFIQIGLGLVVLVVLNIFSNYDIIESNGVKNFITLIYTVPVFFIFILNNLVFWKVAIFLAIGQTIGAYISGLFALKSSGFVNIINYILIVMAIITLARAVII